MSEAPSMTRPCERCGLEIGDMDAWPIGWAWKCLDRGPCYERMLRNAQVAVYGLHEPKPTLLGEGG